MNPILHFFQQVTTKDANIVRVLEKNGGLPEAPKNSHGCKHCAMIDVKPMHEKNMLFHAKEGEYFDKLVCINKEFRNGTMSVNWPRKKIGGQTLHGKYCMCVTRGETSVEIGGGECNFACCNDCLPKRIEEEEQKMNPCRIGSRRVSRRLRQ